MSLKPFTYPFPETRFFHAGSNVYKFKIRYGNSIRGEDIENKEAIVQELEDSIRVILGNSDNLQPFTTKHFIIFPSNGERVSHLKFKHGEIVLAPYPFVFTLYVEMKWFHEKLSPGKPTNINVYPLLAKAGKVAFGNLKMESSLWGVTGKAAGAMMKKRKHVDVPNCPSRQGWTANMVTSSQSPSKKKPPVETARVSAKMEASRLLAVATLLQDRIPCFLADSKWEDSLAGQIIPPLQQTNPPPAKGPTELGTRGFFGFLSSLFPFRYLLRRSSQ
uniref:Membrane anchored junction protein n=1 Tax=Rhinolophus ferrumequinum TaxID=59479 RepID=A0A671E294_RHIFE